MCGVRIMKKTLAAWLAVLSLLSGCGITVTVWRGEDQLSVNGAAYTYIRTMDGHRVFQRTDAVPDDEKAILYVEVPMLNGTVLDYRGRIVKTQSLREYQEWVATLNQEGRRLTAALKPLFDRGRELELQPEQMLDYARQHGWSGTGSFRDRSCSHTGRSEYDPVDVDALKKCLEFTHYAVERRVAEAAAVEQQERQRVRQARELYASLRELVVVTPGLHARYGAVFGGFRRYEIVPEVQLHSRYGVRADRDGGLSLLTLSGAVLNALPYDVKDYQLTCALLTPSGTQRDEIRFTIYRIVKRESPSLFSYEFSSPVAQLTQARCRVTGWQRAGG